MFKPETSLEANEKSEAVLLQAYHEKVGFLEKGNSAGKNWTAGRGRQNMRWIDSIEEAIGMSLQDLRRVVKDRKLWTSMINMVTRNWR